VNNFSNNIKRIRYNTGVSQEAAATYYGITRARYEALENGRNKPSVDILILFSNKLKMSIDELVKSKIR
jgi:transcriptional regulator with XRE-family HTH domain